MGARKGGVESIILKLAAAFHFGTAPRRAIETYPIFRLPWQLRGLELRIVQSTAPPIPSLDIGLGYQDISRNRLTSRWSSRDWHGEREWAAARRVAALTTFQIQLRIDCVM